MLIVIYEFNIQIGNKEVNKKYTEKVKKKVKIVLLY